MSSYKKGQSLPKFGEWDVNDPASAEGYTVIFNKARDEKRSGGIVTVVATEASYNEKRKHKNSIKRKWFCFA